MSVTTPHDRPPLHAVPDRDGPAEDFGRTPPNDQAAEQAVIGALMLDARIIEDVVDTLQGADFYRPAHELIYDAATHLWATGQPVDAVTVTTELTRRGHLTRAGGATYLHTCISAVPSAANASYYAGIVAAKAALRRILDAGTQLTQLAYASTGDPDDVATVLDQAAAKITEIRPASTTTVDTWAPVDIRAVLAGDLTGPAATLLTRRDDKHLLYPAAVHSVSGEPGSGKTWVALVAAAQQITLGRDVGMLDFEDRPQTIADRLMSLGITGDQLVTHLRYIRPDVAITPTTRDQLATTLAGCSLVIIDGITEAMTLHGLSLMDNEDVARWLALIPRHIADLGPSVLQIDHVVKNSDNRGRYAIGGQHKLAGITGVAYKMVTTRSFGKGAKGLAKLVVDKDKHGDVGPNGITAADLHLDATNPDGTLYAWLDTPGTDIAEDGHFRPTILMARVSKQLLVAPGASLNDIKKAVRGKNEAIADAVTALVLEGYVRTEEGARGGSRHYLEKAFEEDD